MLDGGNQVIAFPGSTLHELEGKLAGIDRAPHSVIGSTTIGATIVGGIANNAGGALCKRGSSYTELALYARVNEEGNLELINHLGINNLGETPEEIFKNLEKGSLIRKISREWIERPQTEIIRTGSGTSMPTPQTDIMRIRKGFLK